MERRRVMFEAMNYIVRRIDGDYAYLELEGSTEEELKCVARALLPEEITEGCQVVYEMLSYRLS